MQKSSSASGYKHDCECFELIMRHLKIAGITGIIQQYMHIVDVGHLTRTLCPPMTLKYANANDFQLSWTHAKFGGTVVFPYGSDANVSIDLDIHKISSHVASATVSVIFSTPLCVSLLGNGTSLGNKMMMCVTRLGTSPKDSKGRSIIRTVIELTDIRCMSADTFVNTVFAQDHRDLLVAMLHDGCAVAKSNEVDACIVLASSVFNEACAKMHKKLIRAVYSNFHTDAGVQKADDYYRIPSIHGADYEN